jgi:hypothetical protein
MWPQDSAPLTYRRWYVRGEVIAHVVCKHLLRW